LQPTNGPNPLKKKKKKKIKKKKKKKKKEETKKGEKIQAVAFIGQ
jgi:hypothetical protein